MPWQSTRPEASGLTPAGAIGQIAMASACGLLEEATSALDLRRVGEVVDPPKVLAQEGMTMFHFAHDMAFARTVSGRVAFFHRGALAEVGPADPIFGAPRFPETQQKFLSGLR